MKPMIKYRGGKSRELERIKKWVPSEYNRYVEPFLGGGALFFDLEPEQAIVNDLNGPLMDFYGDVAINFSRLKNELSNLEEIYARNRRQYESLKEKLPNERVKDYNEELYYRIRAQYNHACPTEYLAGTLYFFINKTAYSGMIRFNKNGEFNVPYGRYKNLSSSVITERHSKLLTNSVRMNVDFEEVFSLCNSRDFVFLDPPYDSPFSDYGNVETADGFTESDHRRLARAFFDLPAQALMVIGSTPLTEELYSDNVVDRYKKSYSVNIRNRFKANSEHILVLNKEVREWPL